VPGLPRKVRITRLSHLLSWVRRGGGVVGEAIRKAWYNVGWFTKLGLIVRGSAVLSIIIEEG